MKRIAPIFMLAGLVLASPAMAAEATAAQLFERLKSLAGDWRSTAEASRTVVHYGLMANASTVVETWTMRPGRQSMTVYTLDGDRLLATHYCPQGNAPRLAYTGTDATGGHRFVFVDGANLQDPEGSHEHAFWIRFEPEGTLTRSETYIRNDANYDPERDLGDEESFARMRP